jgi:hypothetical protein
MQELIAVPGPEMEPSAFYNKQPTVLQPYKKSRQLAIQSQSLAYVVSLLIHVQTATIVVPVRAVQETPVVVVGVVVVGVEVSGAEEHLLPIQISQTLSQQVLKATAHPQMP